MVINKYIKKQIKQIIKNIKRIGFEAPLINEIEVPFNIKVNSLQDKIYIYFFDDEIKIETNFSEPDLDNIFILSNLKYTPKRISYLLKKAVNILEKTDR